MGKKIADPIQGKLRIRQALLMLLAIVVASLSLGIWRTSLFKSLDDSIHDLLLDSSISASTSKRIFLVLVDDESLRQFGPWPFDRSLWAKLITVLGSAKSRWIAFDIIFSSKDIERPGGDRAFIDAVRQSGKVILPCYYKSRKILVPETGLLEERWEEEGPFPELAEVSAAGET